MPNTLNQVLGANTYRGVDRLRGGAASIDIQSSQIGIDPNFESKQREMQQFGNGLEQLGQVFENWTQMSQKKSAQTGEERAQYLMNHYTPEQLADARRQGVMLYQDDPYAMKSLHTKIGQTVAQDVDSGLTSDVQKGLFKDRKALDVERAKRMNEQGKQLAESYGSDFDNNDFQIGLNSQAVERNIVLYGAHDKWLNDHLNNASQLQAHADIQSLYKDPKILKAGNSGQIIMGTLEQSRLKNGWSDSDAQNQLRQSVNDIANLDGGAKFLADNADKPVSYNGKTIPLKAYFGEDEWQGLQLTAAGAAQKLDAAKAEEFANGLEGAEAKYQSGDTATALAMIDQMKQKESEDNPTNMNTPNRQKIIALEGRLIQYQVQANEKKAKENAKGLITQGNLQILDDNFKRGINGEQVPTDNSKILGADGKTIPDDDMVAYAAAKIAQINGLDIPEAQKASMKLNYMRLDKQNGAFRSYFTNTINTANAEYNRMLQTGDDSGEHPEFDNLRALYHANPQVVGQMFPEQAGMFARFDEMDAGGMSLNTVIAAERENTNLKGDFSLQKEVNDNWSTQVNNSSGASEGDLTNLDSKTGLAAKQVFLASRYMGKSYEDSFKAAQAYVKNNVATFGDSDVEGQSYGSIPKAALMIGNDPASYTQGKQIVDDEIKRIEAANVTVAGHLAVTTDTNGDILIRSPIEGYQYRMTKQMMQDAANAQQEANRKVDQANEESVRKGLKAQAHYQDIYAHVGEDDGTVAGKIMSVPREAWNEAKDITNGAVAEAMDIGKGAAKRVSESPQERSKRHQRERNKK